MNKYWIIILLLVLLAVLFVLVKSCWAYLEALIKKISLGVRIALIVIIVVVCVGIGLTQGGKIGLGDGAATAQEKESSEAEETADNVKDCIIIREDKILIEGHPAEFSEMEKYIDSHVEANKVLTIVDDYASAEYFRSILDLCKEKGVNYETKNEKWLEDQ